MDGNAPQPQSAENVNIENISEKTTETQRSVVEKGVGTPAEEPVQNAPQLTVADAMAAVNAVASPIAPQVNAAKSVSGVSLDVDHIENQWVQAAEEIIKRTSDTPYAEEEAIEDLQIDYLKKRYGKVIDKKPNI